MPIKKKLKTLAVSQRRFRDNIAKVQQKTNTRKRRTPFYSQKCHIPGSSTLIFEVELIGIA